MAVRAFDTADTTLGKAHDILAAVGIYLRPDRKSLAEVQALHSVGLKLFSIWEKGEPSSASYFTADQGRADGEAARAYAAELGDPAGSTISPAIDYDSNPNEVMAYIATFHDAIKEYGYHWLPYGNGATLQ